MLQQDDEPEDVPNTSEANTNLSRAALLNISRDTVSLPIRDFMAVTIYVWLDTPDKFGHAALQTRHARTADGEDGIYASFYPVGHPALLSRYGRTSKTRNMDWDIAHYQRFGITPFSIRLYGLNIVNIELAFRRFLETSCNFSLLASSIFSKEGTQNCAGLTYYLLEQGGIADIIPSHRQQLSAFSRHGLVGIYVENNFGKYFLSAIRIIMVALSLMGFYGMLCERNDVQKDLFADKIHLLKNCSILTILGGIIGFRSSQVDSDARHYRPLLAGILGGLSGLIFGGGFTVLIKYAAKQHGLVPNSSKYGKYATPLLCLALFYMALSIFGERSFLTRGLASIIGTAVDTPKGQGMIVTPAGIQRLAQAAYHIENSRGSEMFPSASSDVLSLLPNLHPVAHCISTSSGFDMQIAPTRVCLALQDEDEMTASQNDLLITGTTMDICIPPLSLTLFPDTFFIHRSSRVMLSDDDSTTLHHVMRHQT